VQGVGGCDAHSDGLWCVVVFGCEFLASQTPTTMLYLYRLQFAGALTPLCMQLMCELGACLLGPYWPEIFTPTSS
jgi:hypothetical protein